MTTYTLHTAQVGDTGSEGSFNSVHIRADGEYRPGRCTAHIALEGYDGRPHCCTVIVPPCDLVDRGPLARFSGHNYLTTPEGTCHFTFSTRLEALAFLASLYGIVPPQPDPQSDDAPQSHQVVEMPTIAEAVRELIFERAAERGSDPYNHSIWHGDPDFLQMAYLKAGGKHTHPLNVTDAVMGALWRSPLFEHAGYIRSHTRIGVERQVLFAAFKLRKENTKPAHTLPQTPDRHESPIREGRSPTSAARQIPANLHINQGKAQP